MRFFLVVVTLQSYNVMQTFRDIFLQFDPIMSWIDQYNVEMINVMICIVIIIIAICTTSVGFGIHFLHGVDVQVYGFIMTEFRNMM